MTVNIPDFMPILSRGNHYNPQQGACVMEMVSYVAGEDWSDTPECTNTELAFLAQKVNDFVSDDNRNAIALMVPRFIGTSKLKNSSFNRDVAHAISMSGEFTQFKNWFGATELLLTIKNHFNTEIDTNKRLTNEEYDQKAIRILEIALDVADKLLERGEYAVTTEEAFAKMAELPNQKKVVSNV